MLTLFILVTLENFPTYLAEAQAVSPFATAFFISYVVLAAFLVFNLLIGIVITAMEKARNQEAKEQPQTPNDEMLERIAEIQRSLSELQTDLARQAGRS